MYKKCVQIDGKLVGQERVTFPHFPSLAASFAILFVKAADKSELLRTLNPGSLTGLYTNFVRSLSLLVRTFCPLSTPSTTATTIIYK